jgi:signal transduction histidine kinase
MFVGGHSMPVAYPRLFTSEQAVAVPPERLIAFGRLVLSGFAIGALYSDPPDPSTSVQLVITGAYGAFAVVCAAFVMTRQLTLREQYFAHAADMLCVSILMYLTEGPTSPFFVFFTFILLAATLRWNWKGALGTAVVLACTFAILAIPLGAEFLVLEVGELSRATIRAGYILVAGVMLSYVGALQERSRERLSKLAAWPGPDPDGTLEVPIRSALAHAARIMHAPRVLIIWEQPDEPFRHVALWSENKLTHYREGLDRFGSIVLPDLVEASFGVRASPRQLSGSDDRLRLPTGHAIDPDLRQTFSITNALTAPFDLPGCTGRVFLLDRCAYNDDDLLMACLVAMRLGVDVEHHLLRYELNMNAALSERARLANDLHDGVLQGLAAANIQLKLTESEGSAELAAQIAETRRVIATEQQRVRSFVEDTRSETRKAVGEMVLLRDELSKRLRELSSQWGCHIDFVVHPQGTQTSPRTAHHVRHLVAEAVSNAARHGRASRIKIEIDAASDQIFLRIKDNGTGFQSLEGTFTGQELTRQSTGPASILQRAMDLGGRLTLQTSSSGCEIRVEFPHDR